MDDEWDVSRVQQEDINLFDEGNESHSNTSRSSGQKADSSETACGPGNRDHLFWSIKFIHNYIT